MGKRKKSKFIALLMALITCLTTIFSSAGTAFAATAGTITFDYTYSSSGSAIRYNSGGYVNGNYVGGTGEWHLRMFVDGETAFCIQPGVSLHSGNTLKSASSDTWDALSDDQQEAVGLALLYGYQGNRSNLTGSDDDIWVATQIIIWEIVIGCREATGDYSRTSSTIYNLQYGSNYANSTSASAYAEIAALMAEHNTIPSFMSTSKSGITKELSYSDGTYTLTLTDSNGVLSDYTFTSSDSDVKVSKSGNTLTITSEEAFEGTVRITATRNNVPTVSSSAKLIAWGDDSLQDVVTGVENADSVVAYINVETPTGTLALQKSSEDGEIEGITFTISGEGITQTVTTDENGEILVEGLVPGTYTVTEKTYEKYETQSSKTVTIVGGKTTTVTFSNVLKKGSLEVTKTSEDGLVEGVTFHLYGTSLSGLTVDEYAITDENGVAVFEDVLISGDEPYTLEEVDTAEKYVIPDAQSVTIAWNEVTQRSMENVLKKFTVTVTKSDSEEGSAQGDASLAGAVYGLYKDGTLVAEYTTDENGTFTTDEYVCDDNWTIQEISPSEGYLLDETVYSVGAEPENYTIELNCISLDVTEDVIKGSIAIIKHNDDGETQIETPEEGAAFQIYLSSAGSYENAEEDERDTLICDEDGYAASIDLPYGIYTVHQTSGWEGTELMDDFEVYICSDGETYKYLINNSTFESYVKVVKVDAETGNTIPYAGAGFQIYDSNGDLVTMTYTYPSVTTIDTFYTDENGTLITPEALSYGTYTLVEVQAPYGYVLDSSGVSFEISEANASGDAGVTVVIVEMENMPQKGTITVEKTGEVFSNVTVSGEDDAALYQPVYETAALAGAVYEITAAEDIYTPDGTLRYSAGEVVDTITTGEDGTATSIELYLGSYTVTEIETPEGYVLSSETHEVTLTYAGQEVAVTETSVSCSNDRQKASISLTKILETDETYGIGTNDEILSVTFGLYAAEELTAADGTVIPADGLIEIVSVSEDGTASFASDLPFGSYYVQEISTDDHYLTDDTKYSFTFSYAGQDIETVEISVNDGEAIENDLLYGEISGKKVDENGEALEGALIGIFFCDETEFTEETAIMTAVSGEDGSFSFTDVPYGTWIVREIEQPEGYVLCDTQYVITICKDAQTIEIEIENESVYGNISLTKVDADYPDNKLTGAVFEVYADTDDDGELDEEDVLIGEMEETSEGIYEITDLIYGHYLVKETAAPEGFVLDEGVYAVFVEEDGATYEVENEAGVGFINECQTGNLKIVKRSSDGEVEGFSFRVSGDNGYEEVFTTDENGEILIEGLRIGEYTVAEVNDEAAEGYDLPDDKTVTVKTGETTTVKMKNTKKTTTTTTTTETTDSPKTGDDTPIALYAAALAVSAAGIAGICIYSKRRKKKMIGSDS